MPDAAYHRRISEQLNNGASTAEESNKSLTFISVISAVRASQKVKPRCFAVEANLRGPIRNE